MVSDFKMVPTHATPEMIRQGRQARFEEFLYDQDPDLNTQQIYKAMLEAAPQPDTVAVEREAPDLDTLTQRFLACPLPEGLQSDLCVTDPNFPHRMGTNLMNYQEAREMLTYVLGAVAVERDEFEKWAADEGYSLECFVEAGEIEYIDHDTESEWRVWQERALLDQEK